MPNYLKSLKVFLLGAPFFKEGEKLCTSAQYEKALSGGKYPWITDSSYETVHAVCEPEIRKNYVKLPTFQVVLNWVMLILGLLSSVVLGILLLIVFAFAGDFSKRAANLMARKALSTERLKRQVMLLNSWQSPVCTASRPGEQKFPRKIKQPRAFYVLKVCTFDS